MHILFVSLLAILTGTLLLAKTRRDALGKFFAFISWFFIVVGFLLFIGFVCGGIRRMAHHPGPARFGVRHEMMMRGRGPVMHKGVCCPGGKCVGICDKKQCCPDSAMMMKCCPMHLKGDTTAMPCPKAK